MTTLAITLIAIPLALGVYSYLLYPIGLWLVAGMLPRRIRPPEPVVWPAVSITLPVYNEEARIRAAIEQLLALEYPAGRVQIVVISDASTDGTEEIVREYASRGVELLRLTRRGGKTAAENAAAAVVRGEIIVNVDATTEIGAGSLKALIRAFGDPTVGAASGCDVSVGSVHTSGNAGEGRYVGYEMFVRALETRVSSIVGVSGCFYGIRRELYDGAFPPALSRDFATALTAREHGLRAVSVPEAMCGVPRTASLRGEYRRKTRTMHRGIETLWFKRHLMNPFRHGGFAIMLVSHKLGRWLTSLTLPGIVLGVVLLSGESPVARLASLGLLLGGVLAWCALRWPEERRIPRLVSLAGFVAVAAAAGVVAWIESFRHHESPVWEPTRRPA